MVEDNRVDCRRCGFKWAVSADKRGRKDLLCVNCRAKKQTIIQYGLLRCIPHEGQVDSDLNPITDEGELFLPGVRVCGHKDCVTVTHIVGDAQ